MDKATEIFLQNKYKINQETHERKELLEAKPLTLGVIFTNWCNLRCIMCPSERYANTCTLPPSFLSKIQELFPYLERIDWQGGEFFHLGYMKEIFLSLQHFPHIQNVITSNGLLLDKEWVKLLFDLKVKIDFSIDSPRKDIYEYIRRGADFNQLLKCLDLLADLEHKHNKSLYRDMNVVVMKSNYHLLIECVEFARKYGFRNIAFNQVSGIEHGENISYDNDKDIRESINLQARLIDNMFADSGVGIIWNLPGMCDSQAKQPICGNNQEAYLLCDLPWKGMYICAQRQGDIFPDCWCRHPAGNIFRDSLLEVWNGTNMREYRQRLSKSDFNLCNPACRNRLNFPKSWSY
ncbi:MAG: radical SAM protein [Candidatus Omnitrophica bacterium]|nr:radical SAM protein [Candidatus Omnitrophota bacterium]